MPIPLKSSVPALQAQGKKEKAAAWAEKNKALYDEAKCKSDALYTVDNVGELLTDEIKKGRAIIVLHPEPYQVHDDNGYNMSYIRIPQEIIQAIRAAGFEVRDNHSDGVQVILTDEGKRYTR